MGEQETTFKMWLFLDSKKYLRVHNIILPSKNGTTQIDLVIISQYGIFIVETKMKTGWIFNSADNAKWTQTIYNKKFTFQNPLRQTYRHKKILSEFVEIDEPHINTIVYFLGECSLKTELPANVMTSGLAGYIKTFRQELLSFDDVESLYANLVRHKADSDLTKNDHIRSLNERHSSSEACPRCGSALIVKTARKGSNTGSNFLGCKAFPKCRFSKSI